MKCNYTIFNKAVYATQAVQLSRICANHDGKDPGGVSCIKLSRKNLLCLIPVKTAA